MNSPAMKPTMKRFEPGEGWTDSMAPVVSINDYAKTQSRREELPADALSSLGDSIQDVFQSLKINDPELSCWADVDMAIKEVGIKLQEKKQLEARLLELESEIHQSSNLAAELVNVAYQKEMEIHATSRIRLEIAGLLNQRLSNALKK
ncbi:MAG: hypothetical protein RI984_1682 [Pseudomonadota bacterium]|jgi:hypothetical protein